MSLYKIIQLSGLLLVMITYSACDKNDPIIIEDPVYDGTNFASNAATETALRSALSGLSAEMKKGRTAGVSVDFATVTQLYQTGSPSLADITSDYYRGRIEGSGGWLDELTRASGGTYTPGAPQGEGGVYVSNLFDENGLELEQVIEKGLFAAAMYHHAADLLEGDLDEATADRVVAIFGAHPDFPNSDNSSLDNPDRFSAQYTARRDKNDGNGFYSQIVGAFAGLQEAIAAGDDFQSEQNAAAETIKSTWEKAIFATVVNYLHSAISKLSNTNPTDEDKAGALHAYSEVIGFVHGWRGLPAAQKQIADSEIDDLLEILNAPYDAAPTSYTFATDPVNELPKFTQAIDKVQDIYGFSDQDIQDFKENWISKQGR